MKFLVVYEERTDLWRVSGVYDADSKREAVRAAAASGESDAYMAFKLDPPERIAQRATAVTLVSDVAP